MKEGRGREVRKVKESKRKERKGWRKGERQRQEMGRGRGG